MTNFNQGVPAVPYVAMVDDNRNPTGPWYSFFVSLYNRTGGATPSNSASAILDSITNAIGSILYRGASAWQGLAPGSEYEVLRMGSEFPEWDTLDGNSFGDQSAAEFFASPAIAPGIPSFRSIVPSDLGSQAQNAILAGPSGGGPGNPSFRALAITDLDSIEGQYPGTITNDNADAGNIGEYISASGSAVVLTSGDAANVASIVLPPGDWDLWGNFVTTPAASTTQSNIQAWLSTVSATDPTPPNQGAYTQHHGSIGAGLTVTFPVGMMRISIAAQTTVYLSGLVTFATSTLTAGGFLAARRRR